MTKTTSTLQLQPEDNARLIALCGEVNSHLAQIEKQLSIQITARGNTFEVSGEATNVKKGHRVLRQLYSETAENDNITAETVFMALSNHMNSTQDNSDSSERTNHSTHGSAVTSVIDSQEDLPAEGANRDMDKSAQANAKLAHSATKIKANPPKSVPHSPIKTNGNGSREYNHTVLNTPKMKIVGKNPSQRHYIGQMLYHDISFGIGPAGTGKTYLAVACAVHALTNHEIQRIILVRPAVEAGERLGFLPGDIGQKVDPYLRPLYDAMYDMLGFDKVAKLIEKNVIEIAPLAYMRGRTLNDAAVILDEAQNTTIEQMKMFLTRVGFGSKAMITGDLTQIDLPKHMKSGLRHAAEVLEGIDEIGFSFFSPDDVVRHPLVQRIVKAYEAFDAKETGTSS